MTHSSNHMKGNDYKSTVNLLVPEQFKALACLVPRSHWWNLFYTWFIITHRTDFPVNLGSF